MKRIDFNRRIDGRSLDHGFERFFGTACCPTTIKASPQNPGPERAEQDAYYLHVLLLDQ